MKTPFRVDLLDIIFRSHHRIGMSDIQGQAKLRPLSRQVSRKITNSIMLPEYHSPVLGSILIHILHPVSGSPSFGEVVSG